MPEVRVTRRLHFSAAHRLFHPDWDDARNAEVFGEPWMRPDGVTSLIDVLTEMRVVTPNRDGLYSAGDVIRVESVRGFLDAGMSLETLSEGIDITCTDFLAQCAYGARRIKDANDNLQEVKGLGVVGEQPGSRREPVTLIPAVQSWKPKPG